MRKAFDQNLDILDRVSEFFGSKPKLAKALGISVQAIYQWKSIPRGRAYQIEVLTKRKFKASDLTERIK